VLRVQAWVEGGMKLAIMHRVERWAQGGCGLYRQCDQASAEAKERTLHGDSLSEKNKKSIKEFIFYLKMKK
jgi:hypothetical protein